MRANCCFLLQSLGSKVNMLKELNSSNTDAAEPGAKIETVEAVPAN